MSQEVVLLNFQTKHCFRLKHELYSHRYKKKEIGMCQNSVIFLCVSAFFWALWIDCSWAFSCCRSLRDAESFSSTWLITAASLGEKKWEKEQREGEEKKKNTSWEEKQNKREGGLERRDWQLCLPSISPTQRVSEPPDFSLHLAHPLGGLEELNVKRALGALSSLVHLRTADGTGRSRSGPSGVVSQFRVQKVKHVTPGRRGSPLPLPFPFAQGGTVFGDGRPSLALRKLGALVQRAAFREHHGLHGLHATRKRFPQTCTNAGMSARQTLTLRKIKSQTSYDLRPK